MSEFMRSGFLIMYVDKLVISLVSPLGTSLLLWLLALVICVRARNCAAASNKMSWALVLAALGSVWLLAWSFPAVSHALRGQLEDAYPPMVMEEVPRAQAIVVLGGGIRPAEQSGQMPDMGSAADRVWLAARLFKAGKGHKLLVSGGSDRTVSLTSEAQAIRELLLDMGVPDDALILEEQSRNTRQNATYAAKLLREQGIQKILLVTSALHMSRARALFEAQGLDVIPVAADHQARHRFAAVDWIPDSDALDGSARAIKELVARWTGR